VVQTQSGETAEQNKQELLLKDKTETVHGLLEQQQTLSLLETCYALRAGGKSGRHEAPVNSVVIQNAFCRRTADTPDRYLNDTMMFVQAVFHNVWSKVTKQKKGLAKSLLIT